jgi:hypothetical protein
MKVACFVCRLPWRTGDLWTSGCKAVITKVHGPNGSSVEAESLSSPTKKKLKKKKRNVRVCRAENNKPSSSGGVLPGYSSQYSVSVGVYDK